jgi:hypothetical protein
MLRCGNADFNYVGWIREARGLPAQTLPAMLGGDSCPSEAMPPLQDSKPWPAAARPALQLPLVP